MFVKCRYCGNKIDKNNAFKVIIKGKNNYYCNEKEYKKIEEEKANKIKIYEVIDEIFGYKVINTAMTKEISSIAKDETYTRVLNYVLENKQFLEKIMNKNFTNEYGKIRYFSTIIKNNIADYKEIKKEENNYSFNIETVKTIYKPKKHKKTLHEYLEEYKND